MIEMFARSVVDVLDRDIRFDDSNISDFRGGSSRASIDQGRDRARDRSTDRGLDLDLFVSRGRNRGEGRLSKRNSSRSSRWM